MRVRAVAAIALSGALALGLSGCNVIGHAPAATMDQYDPSDGVNVSAGALSLGNLMIISEDGELGSLVGAATNLSSEDIEFTFQWNVDDVWFSVDLVAGANGRTDWGFGDGAIVQLAPVAIPGAMLDAAIVVDGKTFSVFVPVLDTTLAEYEDLAPVPAPEIEEFVEVEEIEIEAETPAP
ncbi:MULTISPECIES: hypothetical protein [unclassified Salinibacterium]|uniref:hypothetical protein n=1 Tax=unclassified Salinibacterium TaxID=2632331 RepID=UPI0014200184|nr:MULTISPECIES: hypothetical protein [unclassified Salinibacterium]